MTDIFQNQYGGLDPTAFADNIVDAYNPEDPRNPRYNPEDEAAKKIIEGLKLEKTKSRDVMDSLQERLNKDPLTEANQKWKDQFHWSGAPTSQKLKSVGIGALDVISALAKKPTSKDRIKAEEQQRFLNNQHTIPTQITNERNVYNNVSDNLATQETTLQKIQAKRTIEKADNEYMKLRDSLKDETAKARLDIQRQMMINNGNYTAQKIKESASKVEIAQANKDVPNNLFSAATMDGQTNKDGTPRLPTGTLDKIKGMLAAGKNPSSGWSHSMGPQSVKFVEDPITGEVKEEPFRSVTWLNRNTQESKQGDPGQGKVMALASPEYKRLKETTLSVDLFRNAATTFLGDLQNRPNDAREQFNDMDIGRILTRMSERDPTNAAAYAEAMNSQSLAALQHIRVLTGGRFAAGFAEALEGTLNAKGGTKEMKAASLLQQYYSLQMAQDSMMGKSKYDKYFIDPSFYEFMKQKTGSLINRSIKGITKSGPEPLSEIIRQYEESKNPIAAPKATQIPFIKQPEKKTNAPEIPFIKSPEPKTPTSKLRQQLNIK
tara:strand:+ start:955 stop:2595 length:1641 start_codon:yes stop_codon:yes gene_type:complete